MSSLSYTVLIVETPSTDQTLYRRFLLADSSCQYTLLEADSVATAVMLCKTTRIDGILIDDALPTANLALFQELQTCLEDYHAPIVVISSESDPAVVVRAIKLGAEDYLLKQTLTPEQLQLAMRSAIENARLRLQLQHQEERFRISVENMLDCFGIFSAIRNESSQIIDFQIDYLNRAACENNRMPRAMQIGKRLCEVLPSHRTSGLFDEYCRIVETGEPLIKESLIYEDDFNGQRLVRAFDIHATKLDDGFVASWRDVTTRRQAELERQQQLERERIFNRIVQQIQQSLNSVEILNSAVTEVRQFLQADRAFVYRFNSDFSGVIVVESVAEGWSSALTAAVEDTYFLETHGEDYRQGRIQVTENIQTAGLTDCHVEMLTRFQIQANLVVPILQGETLWGLLVLNQCAHPRQWQPAETELLKQLAAQLGIALQQAELHQQVQESRERLELSLEGSQQGLWAFDPAADQSYWSPQCKRLFGLESDQALISSDQFFNCLHPDDRDRVTAAVQEALQTFGYYDIEYRVVWPDQSIHWIHAKARVLRDSQGQPRQMIGTVADVTERRQTEAKRQQIEAALMASNERFELAAAAVNCLIYDCDLQQNTIERSSGLTNLFGYSPDEAEPTPEWWFNRVHPDQRSPLQERKRAVVLGTDTTFCFEYQVQHRDGHYVWVQDHGSIVRNASGQAIRVVGSTIDITDRKRSEQQLRDSEERLQLGVQVAGVAIAQFDYAADLVTLSPEAATLYGFAADQTVITRDQIHATFHPEEYEALMEMIRQVLDPAGAGWFAREHRVVWPTGEVRWLNVRKQVFFDRASDPARPVYAILAAVDITERKRIEAKLQENEQRFKAIIENSRAAIFVKDAQGHYLLINRECEQLFKVTNDWIRGKTDCDLFPPDVADTLRVNDRRVLETGEALTLEESIPLEDGIHTYIAVKFPLLDSNGKPYAICGISTDISDRVRLQAERAQLLAAAETARAEAEAANRSKDDFVSLVAHELRSPLNAIMGWAQLLQTRQFDAATVQKALETIIRNTQAQVQLVEDLLDVSRMVRGSLRLIMTPVNLVAVIESAVETVRPTAEAKALRLETRLTGLETISGDFQRLQQVVLNLLTNAIKFTPSGGRVQVRLDQQQTLARIQVIDTGKGISPDFLPHIFERFQQDSQNATAKQGLGLGLAIVKYIVEQHGGTITADSQGEGWGATFTVMLPLFQDAQLHLLPAEPAIPLPADTTAAPLAGVRVLLVDDDADMLDLATVILTQIGAVVQTANSAAIALQQLASFQPDLLISDIAMPGQDGYELLRQVHSRVSTEQLPAIALTAYASEVCQEDSLRAGFAYHLVKPVEPEELVSVILGILQRRSP